MMEPLRVLHVVTKMDCGGLETMIMNYYRWINRESIQFDFLTHRKETGKYDSEIIKLGGKIYYGTPLSIKGMKAYMRWLKGFFDEHPEYCIIHSHLDALSAYVLFAAKRAGIPVRIAHSHNVNFDKDYKYVFRLISKRLISRVATDFWGCSENAIDFMFGNNIRKKYNWRVVKNAIETKKFSYNPEIRAEYREKLGLQNDFVIGHIGRFCYQKNQEYLLKLLKKINSPNIKLILVGKGERLKKIRKLIKNQEIKKNVLFLGEKKNVEDYLQAMDVFCFPSRYEGLGIALLEAQASGLPCIVSNKVPDDAIITRTVRKVKGFVNVDAWIKSIQMVQGYTRRNDVRYDFIQAHYDIVEEAQILENAYKKMTNTVME